MSASAWRAPFEGTNLAVLADCHIRDGGPQFPASLFPRLQGADLIVTLGGMGEKSGLDRLRLRLPGDPEVCRADDAEIVADGIAELSPPSRDGVA